MNKELIGKEFDEVIEKLQNLKNAVLAENLENKPVVETAAPVVEQPVQGSAPVMETITTEEVPADNVLSEESVLINPLDNAQPAADPVAYINDVTNQVEQVATAVEPNIVTTPVVEAQPIVETPAVEQPVAENTVAPVVPETVNPVLENQPILEPVEDVQPVVETPTPVVETPVQSVTPVIEQPVSAPVEPAPVVEPTMIDTMPTPSEFQSEPTIINPEAASAMEAIPAGTVGEDALVNAMDNMPNEAPTMIDTMPVQETAPVIDATIPNVPAFEEPAMEQTPAAPVEQTPAMTAAQPVGVDLLATPLLSQDELNKLQEEAQLQVSPLENGVTENAPIEESAMPEENVAPVVAPVVDSTIPEVQTIDVTNINPAAIPTPAVDQLNTQINDNVTLPNENVMLQPIVEDNQTLGPGTLDPSVAVVNPTMTL